MPEPNQPLIRPAREADMETILDLWEALQRLHSAWDAHAWTTAPDGRERMGEWLRQSLSDEQRVLLVAEANGQVAGFVHAVLGSPPPCIAHRSRLGVSDLCVAEDRRREGLGRALMEAVDAWGLEQGAQEVNLSVAVANEDALAFYRQLGFEPLTIALRRLLDDDCR